MFVFVDFYYPVKGSSSNIITNLRGERTEESTKFRGERTDESAITNTLLRRATFWILHFLVLTCLLSKPTVPAETVPLVWRPSSCAPTSPAPRWSMSESQMPRQSTKSCTAAGRTLDARCEAVFLLETLIMSPLTLFIFIIKSMCTHRIKGSKKRMSFDFERSHQREAVIRLEGRSMRGVKLVKPKCQFLHPKICMFIISFILIGFKYPKKVSLIDKFDWLISFERSHEPEAVLQLEGYSMQVMLAPDKSCDIFFQN